MLKLIEKKGSMLRRCPLTAGQRVSRRYRRAKIQRTEYKKLKAIVPSISAKNKVTKVEVIEEAIKYIDELHKALAARVPFMHGTCPPFLGASPQSVLDHMLRSTPVFQDRRTNSSSSSILVSQSAGLRFRPDCQQSNGSVPMKLQLVNPVSRSHSHPRLDSAQSLSSNIRVGVAAGKQQDCGSVNSLSDYLLQTHTARRAEQMQSANLKP